MSKYWFLVQPEKLPFISLQFERWPKSLAPHNFVLAVALSFQVVLARKGPGRLGIDVGHPDISTCPFHLCQQTVAEPPGLRWFWSERRTSVLFPVSWKAGGVTNSVSRGICLSKHANTWYFKYRLHGLKGSCDARTPPPQRFLHRFWIAAESSMAESFMAGSCMTESCMIAAQSFNIPSTCEVLVYKLYTFLSCTQLQGWTLAQEYLWWDAVRFLESI